MSALEDVHYREVSLYHYVLSFEILFDILKSLEAFRRVRNGKTSKNIKQYFNRGYLILYLLSN